MFGDDAGRTANEISGDGREDVEDAVLGPAGDDGFGGLVLEAVLPGQPVGEGGPEFGQPGGGGVARFALPDGLDPGLGDVLRGGEVGLAQAQVDDRLPLGFEFLGPGTDGEGGTRRDAPDTW